MLETKDQLLQQKGKVQENLEFYNGRASSSLHVHSNHQSIGTIFIAPIAKIISTPERDARNSMVDLRTELLTMESRHI